MYIILTSKPGQYRSESAQGIAPLESHAYFYGDRHVATFTIAQVDRPARVTIIETTGAHTVNHVPTKFFEHFATREAALQSLHELVDAAREARLAPVSLAEAGY